MFRRLDWFCCLEDDFLSSKKLLGIRPVASIYCFYTVMSKTVENFSRHLPYLLFHDAHLERRLGVLHRLADAHLGVLLGRLVHLRQHPVLLPLQAPLAGILHALRLVAQARHLLLGAGDDAQGLLHDGGAQVDGLLLVRQVVNAG